MNAMIELNLAKEKQLTHPEFKKILLKSQSTHNRIHLLDNNLSKYALMMKYILIKDKSLMIKMELAMINLGREDRLLILMI